MAQSSPFRCIDDHLYCHKVVVCKYPTSLECREYHGKQDMCSDIGRKEHSYNRVHVNADMLFTVNCNCCSKVTVVSIAALACAPSEPLFPIFFQFTMKRSVTVGVLPTSNCL